MFRLLLFLISVPVICQNPHLPENLGTSINSEFEERAPLITPDGRTLFFIRQYYPDYKGRDKGNQDIWYSVLDSSGNWSKAIIMDEPINNTLSNGVLAAAPDGSWLLLFGRYTKDGQLNGVSITRREKSGWSQPESLFFDNYSNMAKWFMFHLSNDGKVMVMSIKTEDSRGKNDLYVSFHKNGNNWSEPVNLGDRLNTVDMEITPFIAADGSTLYFSSDKPGGFGDYDVYLSHRLDDTWLNWSEPVNLGPKINTKGFDAYYKIDWKGEYAYFASSENSFGMNDIHRIKLPEKAKPKPVAIIRGFVYDRKDTSLIRALIKCSIAGKDTSVYEADMNPETLEYTITILTGFNYTINASAENYIGISENIDLTDSVNSCNITRDIFLAPINSDKPIRLNNIFFDFNSSVLKPESYPELNRLYDFLLNNRGLSIEIQGHTDDRGTNEYNLALSEDRCRAVLQYLINKGISQDRLRFKAYGEEKPLVENTNDASRQENRRVEFIILK